jgi:hypothetical protein
VAVVGQHRRADGQHLVAVLDAHVHVHPVDEHLAAPPLGAVDQRLVALLVGDALVVPLGERVGAGAHQLDPQRVGDAADLLDRPLQVRPRLLDRAADARDHLDGVEQELLADQGVLAATLGRDRVEHRLGDLPQVAGIGVDQRELPLDSDRRALRLGERDGCEREAHDTIVPHWPRLPIQRGVRTTPHPAMAASSSVTRRPGLPPSSSLPAGRGCRPDARANWQTRP